MAQNIDNIRIGPCEIWEGDVGTGTLYGHTKGGVTFSFERNFTDLTVDKYGSSPVNMALTGQDLKVTARLAEPVLTYLRKAIPEGQYDSGSQSGKLGLGRDSGYLLRQNAVQLVFKPLGSVNDDENIYIWKAVSSETVELDFTVEDQRILEITWRALIDENQPAGYRLGRVGDATIS